MNPNDKLPCDVKLPPSTTIGKGCPVSTLLVALEQRRKWGDDPATKFPQPGAHSRLTPQAEREIEASFRNDQEAHELLALIVAEFNSDPQSVQCFDLRIVERAKLCVAARRAHVEKRLFG